jgi:hypothetical protein
MSLLISDATRIQLPEAWSGWGLARWPAVPALLLFLVVVAVAVRPAAPPPPSR